MMTKKCSHGGERVGMLVLLFIGYTGRESNIFSRAVRGKKYRRYAMAMVALTDNARGIGMFDFGVNVPN